MELRELGNRLREQRARRGLGQAVNTAFLAMSWTAAIPTATLDESCAFFIPPLTP